MAKSSKQTKAPSGKKALKTSKPETESDLKPKGVSQETLAESLPPIALVLTIIACSGFLFIFSFRDVFATGRIIGGSMDEAMLVRPTYEQ
jgi:hypothetical protein